MTIAYILFSLLLVHWQVMRVIELEDGRLCSASFDKTCKVWNI